MSSVATVIAPLAGVAQQRCVRHARQHVQCARPWSATRRQVMMIRIITIGVVAVMAAVIIVMTIRGTAAVVVRDAAVACAIVRVGNHR